MRVFYSDDYGSKVHPNLESDFFYYFCRDMKGCSNISSSDLY